MDAEWALESVHIIINRVLVLSGWGGSRVLVEGVQ